MCPSCQSGWKIKHIFTTILLSGLRTAQACGAHKAPPAGPTATTPSPPSTLLPPQHQIIALPGRRTCRWTRQVRTFLSEYFRPWLCEMVSWTVVLVHRRPPVPPFQPRNPQKVETSPLWPETERPRRPVGSDHTSVPRSTWTCWKRWLVPKLWSAVDPEDVPPTQDSGVSLLLASVVMEMDSSISSCFY